MPKLWEHHSKGPRWCKIIIDFIFWVWPYPSKMEVITNKAVSKEQHAQNFENLKYDPLENSGNISLGNSSDPDLH